jgi:protein TonB
MGELLVLGFMMLLPLIYTDKLSVFGFSHLPMIAPRGMDPKPLRTVTAGRQTGHYVRPFNPRSIYTPGAELRPVALLNDLIDTPRGDEVFGSVPGGPELIPGAVNLSNHITAKPPEPKVEPVTKPPEKPKVELVRMGGKVLEAMIVRRAIPVYPPLARQARVQGVVKLVGVISQDGTIQRLQVISGHPLLVQSAVDAVRQWVYRPTLLNGRPVEVEAPIDVNFTLQ